MSLDPTLIVTGEETHVGQVRSINQDSCTQLVHPKGHCRLLLIADGMGGHHGGEIASQLTVETVEQAFAQEGDQIAQDPGAWLRRTLEAANARVYEEGHGQPSLMRMGTTAVVVLFLRDDLVWLAHVGDSRIYRLREHAFEQITGDHSVVGELLRQGHLTKEQAREHPQRNEIQRAIGTQPSISVEVQSCELQPGDQYLLCSDGLSDMVVDEDVAEVLERQQPEEAVHELVQMANLAGGNDNVTVQVALVSAQAFENTAPLDPRSDSETSETRGPSSTSDDSSGDDAGSGQRAAWVGAAIAIVVVGLYLVLRSPT